MFHFFFKNVFFCFIKFSEVLKYFKNSIYFFEKQYLENTFLNSFIFTTILWPDENTYYVFFSFFDFLFFSHLYNIDMFFYFFHYIYFCFLSNISFLVVYS